VGHGKDFHTSGGFPKNGEVGKPLEHHSARAECVFGELPGVISNSLDRAVKLIHEHLRGPHTAQPVPFRGGFGFLQRGRVNSNGCRSRLQPRPETAARLLPGDEMNGSAVDLLKTSIDLLPPGFFRGSVDRLIQTANQGVDQRSANFRR